MRIALMGSNNPAVQVAVPDADLKAFFSQLGDRADNATGFGYPFAYTDDGICEIWYRIEVFRVIYTLATQFTDSGDTFKTTATFDGSITLVADEEERMTRGLTDQPPSWTGLILGNIQTQTNSDPPVDTPTNFDPQLRFSATQSIATGEIFTPYFWRPATETWLPNMEFFLNPAAAALATHSSLSVLVGGVVSTQVGQYRGQNFNISTQLSGAIPGIAITSFSLSITPTQWLEYRRSNGTEPIWDINTGAELRNHSTTQT